MLAAVLAATILALTVAPLSLAALAAPAAPSVQRPTATPPPDFSKTTCTVTTTTAVQPGAFLAGEDVAVTRTVRERCIYRPNPLHLALVLDGTAAMAGTARDEAVMAMETVLEGLEFYFRPGINRVAVITIEDRVRTRCAWTSDLERARRCIRQLGARGDASLAEGLRVTRRVLVDGRGLWPTLDPSEYIRQVVVVASRGADRQGCDAAGRQADLARGDGTLVATVCTGDDCADNCLRHLAYSPRYAFEAREASRVRRLVLNFLNSDHFPGPTRYTVTETLPTGVFVVDGSASPPPSAVLYAPTRLVWSLVNYAGDAQTLSYRVRTHAPGYQALSAGMTGTFRDTYGLTGTVGFDVPRARVLDPSWTSGR